MVGDTMRSIKPIMESILPNYKVLTLFTPFKLGYNYCSQTYYQHGNKDIRTKFIP